MTIYFLFQIEYNTQTATKPTKPSAPKVLITPVTEPITSVTGKNGSDLLPPNNTSNATNIAIRLTATSAIPAAHFLIDTNTSIFFSSGNCPNNSTRTLIIQLRNSCTLLFRLAYYTNITSFLEFVKRITISHVAFMPHLDLEEWLSGFFSRF